MVKGEKIAVGGEEMVLPPLNLDDVEKYWGQLLDGSLFKDVSACAQIFHSALVRNYPDLTMEEMDDALSPQEMMAAIPVLLRISGFVSGEPEGGST